MAMKFERVERSADGGIVSIVDTVVSVGLGGEKKGVNLKPSAGMVDGRPTRIARLRKLAEKTLAPAISPLPYAPEKAGVVVAVRSRNERLGLLAAAYIVVMGGRGGGARVFFALAAKRPPPDVVSALVDETLEYTRKMTGVEIIDPPEVFARELAKRGWRDKDGEYAYDTPTLVKGSTMTRRELLTEILHATAELREMSAAVYHGGEYTWWVYTAPRATVIKTKNGKHTVRLEEGSVFGVRPASSQKGMMRLIVPEKGTSRVFSYPVKFVERLTEKAERKKGRKPLAARVEKTLMAAVAALDLGMPIEPDTLAHRDLNRALKTLVGE